MSSLMIRDLPHGKQLDRQAMSAISGGGSAMQKFGPFANVNVDVNQNIVQLQNIDVNVLNDVGIIGSGFGPLKLDVSPKQFAKAHALV